MQAAYHYTFTLINLQEIDTCHLASCFTWQTLNFC